MASKSVLIGNAYKTNFIIKGFLYFLYLDGNTVNFSSKTIIVFMYKLIRGTLIVKCSESKFHTIHTYGAIYTKNIDS